MHIVKIGDKFGLRQHRYAIMKIRDLLEQFSQALALDRDRAAARGLDAPVELSGGRPVLTAGSLHLYAFNIRSGAPPDGLLLEDIPVTVVPPPPAEPTEGYVVGRVEGGVLVQTFDPLDKTLSPMSLVPDTTAFFDAASRRLTEMTIKQDTYTLGAAERLLPWLDPHQGGKDQAAGSAVSLSTLNTIWSEDPTDRRAKATTQIVNLVRNNKRLLVIAPDHRSADIMLATIARALRAAGLSYKSLLSRYEMTLHAEAAGMSLPELGFEAQMHQFYAKSRADKASLRRKYERFRELTPLLAYKAEKQRDLDEVKLLEWRLVTRCTELQDRIKEINATLQEYETLPIWKRLAMQTVGKNVGSLAEYRTIYEQTIQDLRADLDAAKRRIEELKPEAAIPKEMRPEYQELNEEIVRLGGTKKIRELLAAEEGTNRQAFIQNKRVVVATAARVISDPLFARVRFDVLVADEAPFIPAPFLLASAGLAREKIILSGDTRDIPTAGVWASPWRRGNHSDQPSAVSAEQTSPADVQRVHAP